MTTAEIETANHSLKINLSRSFSIGVYTEVGPLAVLFAFELPCSIMAYDTFDHSLYCSGIMLSALNAPLIDSPASMCLLTFLKRASLPKIAKCLLLLLGVRVPIMMDNIDVNKQR